MGKAAVYKLNQATHSPKLTLVDGRYFDIDYVYNSSQALTQKTLRSGRQVLYNPDGFGRPRIAQTGSVLYANNIQYHESGNIKQFTFGNGHVYSQTFTENQLPLRILTSKASTKPLDLT